ncbi:Gliding motility regulatory protein [Maioricimonas rarisocia]|uniref:histidine kinase n=1 Tax=Maioricimonas rarisocia TaxID=2528026 RepID=A0A517ZAK1_9PLAN|nr:hybrid sensor histidine kinase/response regulator [Maioricimonas rarisocia]QDU39524.1 Gliding motility regulatory protein [Maioricimonas rarisocia]
MDKAKLLERLMATFLDELDDHVRSINEDLLTLEKGPDEDERKEILARLFRAAHSLKGAARAVDQQPIERVCHRLEEVFTGLRERSIEVSPQLCSLMLSAVDAIEAAGVQLREGAPLETDSLAGLEDPLEKAARGEPWQGDASPFEEPAEKERAVEATPADADTRQAEATAAGDANQDTPNSAPVSSASSESVVSDDSRPVAPAAGQEVAPKRRREPAASLATVRVAEEKLDSLLAQAGELLVARHRVEGRTTEAETLLDFVTAWKAEWLAVERTLGSLVRNDGADPLLRRSPRMAARIEHVVVQNGEFLRRLERMLDDFKQDLVADARTLKHASTAVQDDVHRLRMLPFSEACAGLERAVRDLSNTTGKQVRLQLEGGDIQVDRAVLEQISAPLMHLVRNAVDHGIESSEDRRAAGKPLPAQVTVTASLRGGQVEVVVADDGQGLNLDRIRQKLRDRNLPEPRDEKQLVQCIFLPGFSTASIITDVSGRGVGMDVVRNQLEALRGTIDIETKPGEGTRFVLSVPLTLTTIAALFVEAGGRTYALPSSNVRELVRFDSAQIRTAHGRSVAILGGAPLPVASLARTLGAVESQQASPHTRLLGVIVTSGADETVFTLDDVVGEREVVIKNLGPRVRRVPLVSGATILRSGRIALLLNAPQLTRAASGGQFLSAMPSQEDDRPTSHRLLVVDDSMTTRALMKSILESAGYNVVGAVDGEEAWERLQNENDVSAVVTDVDMPRMDGFALTQAIRNSQQWKKLPVVLVTARDREEDRALGVRSGADAYLVKSTFDQNQVLETLEQLLG